VTGIRLCLPLRPNPTHRVVNGKNPNPKPKPIKKGVVHLADTKTDVSSLPLLCENPQEGRRKAKEKGTRVRQRELVMQAKEFEKSESREERYPPPPRTVIVWALRVKGVFLSFPCHSFNVAQFVLGRCPRILFAA